MDLLVNDEWGGDRLSEWGAPSWEHSLENGLLMQRRAVFSHLIPSRPGAPLMVKRGSGLIIEITDGTNCDYRGTLYYRMAKISAIHMAAGMAADLRSHGVTALALPPGFLRSEAMLELGVLEHLAVRGRIRHCGPGRLAAALGQFLIGS